MRRHSVPRAASRKDFTRNASRVHGKNLLDPRAMPMRGGIRL